MCALGETKDLSFFGYVIQDSDMIPKMWEIETTGKIIKILQRFKYDFKSSVGIIEISLGFQIF